MKNYFNLIIKAISLSKRQKKATNKKIIKV